MPSVLPLIVTEAGRAAVVNANNTGTDAVRVAEAGLTDQPFAATREMTALPGELKRLATIAGEVVAADTIHVTIADDSADTYSLHGFGLYLEDGTLFAAYGQQDAIMEKSSQSTMLLATDTIFADLDVTALTFGDTSFANPPATTEKKGIIELATPAEAAAGTDPVRAMTPATHKATVDHRFGSGAPTAFVKGLLNKTTAALFCAALGLKNAAFRDEGSGNGLDADTLDGQHGAYYLRWDKLTGMPSSFPPADHQHSASDITSGTLPVARGGIGRGSLTAGSYLVGAGANAVGLKTPAEVRANIGAAAAAHSHNWGDINDPPATATRWPKFSEVGDVPSFVRELGPISDLDALSGNCSFSFSNSSSGAPESTGAYDAVGMQLAASGQRTQIVWLAASAVYTRTDDGGSWSEWDLLVQKSMIGSAASRQASDFATAAQGGKADSAVQPQTSVKLARVIVDADGEAGVELLSSQGGRNVRVIQSATGNVGIYDAAAGTYLFVINKSNDASVHGGLSADGNISGQDLYASGSVSCATFSARNSDPRLKDHLQPLELDPAAVDAISAWSWTLNDRSKRPGLAGAGVRSDEVRRVLPQAVHQDAAGYDTVDYAQLAVVLAIHSCRRIAGLEARVAGQQREMREMVARIEALEARA